MITLDTKQTWTWLPLDLGHSSLKHARWPVEATWMDGGGFVPSVIIWRIKGRVLGVVEAGMA